MQVGSLALALLAAGCAVDVQPAEEREPVSSFHRAVAPQDTLTVLENETTWRVELDDLRGEARASFDCPFWWGCDVLATFESVSERDVEVELSVGQGARAWQLAQATLGHDEVHARVSSATSESFEPAREELSIRIAPESVAALERAGIERLSIDVRVGWQSLGSWACGSGCVSCTSGSSCGLGGSCLERGICFDGNAPAPGNGDCVPPPIDPAVACAACEPLLRGSRDPSLSRWDELGVDGSRCYLVDLDDDPMLPDEQVELSLSTPGDEGIYELRLYRNADTCAARRPLAVAFAHGEAHVLNWLESAAPDDGTFVVQVVKRSGPRCGGAFSLSVSGLL